MAPRPGLLRAGVAVTSGSDPAQLTLRIPRTTTIRGRVLSADGSPVQGATILFPIPGPVDLNAIQDTTTDDDGRFELPGLAESCAPFDVRVIVGADGDVHTHTMDPAAGDVTVRLD